MSHQNKTLLISSYTHGKLLQTHTDTRTETHTHTQNSKGSFQMTIHPKLSGYRNTFSKAAFHLRIFSLASAVWTPVTYFHLAAESLQDCQHFKRVKTFTLLQKSSNMKNLLLDFLVIIFVISDRVFSPVKVVQCPLTKDARSVVLKWLYLNLYECAERPAGGRVYRCTVVSRGHLAVDSGFFCGKRASILSATGGKDFEGRGHDPSI